MHESVVLWVSLQGCSETRIRVLLCLPATPYIELCHVIACARISCRIFMRQAEHYVLGGAKGIEICNINPHTNLRCSERIYLTAHRLVAVSVRKT